MRNVSLIANVFAAAALLVSCGDNGEVGDMNNRATGAVHIALTGDAGYDLMATIALRELFSSDAYLLQCKQKPHDSPDGHPFCDELIVLPPGVYEVITQSSDPSCQSELDWYKVVVKEDDTVELPIALVCGAGNGGLDVVVTQEYQPSVMSLDFTFYGTCKPANKYICIGHCKKDVTISITVNDPDTACEDLSVSWSATDSIGNDVTSELFGAPADPDCVFDIVVDAQTSLPAGTYSVTFTVEDAEGHEASFTFPVHLMLCSADAGDSHM